MRLAPSVGSMSLAVDRCREVGPRVVVVMPPIGESQGKPGLHQESGEGERLGRCQRCVIAVNLRRVGFDEFSAVPDVEQLDRDWLAVFSRH